MIGNRESIQTSYENSKYKDVNYWNCRYLKEESFEWCKSYDAFQHLIKDHVSKNARILILGCGNSTLSNDLYQDGYENITNIDFSSVAIKNAAEKSRDLKMSWIIMDIKSLLFAPSSFDIVLEKATLDSLLVDEKDPWKLSRDASCLMDNILFQVSSLLCDGGKFISITFAQPHFRKKILCRRRYNWSYKYFTYGDSFHYFFYLLTKAEPSTFYASDEEECEEAETKTYDSENRSEAPHFSDDTDMDFISRISDQFFS